MLSRRLITASLLGLVIAAALILDARVAGLVGDDALYVAAGLCAVSLLAGLLIDMRYR